MANEKSTNSKQENCFSQFFGDEDFLKMMKEKCMKMNGCDCMAMMQKFSSFKENRKDDGGSDEKSL